MVEYFKFGTAVFMAFFAVMNPIANTPLFLTLTSEESDTSRKKIAWQSVFVAFLITIFFCLLGNQIFILFGITIPAFKITGGILITSIGFESLKGRQSMVQRPSLRAHEQSLENDISLAITPLGIPLLSGPGTITTAVNYSSNGNLVETAITITAFAILCLITYVCFLFSENIKRSLGLMGINVVTRVMGLILAVVGVQMIVTGLKGAFPFITQ